MPRRNSKPSQGGRHIPTPTHVIIDARNKDKQVGAAGRKQDLLATAEFLNSEGGEYRYLVKPIHK